MQAVVMFVVVIAAVVVVVVVVASNSSSCFEKLVSGKFGEGGIQVVADCFVLVLLVHQFVF